MDTEASELLQKIRDQFDKSPYPGYPLESSPKNDRNLLFIHNLVTPFYLRNQRIIDSKEVVVLDVGCGNGYKSLALAEANPGARIVGVDLSEVSIQLARERLKYHGFNNVEFHALAIAEIPKLGLEFDYINCDEVLYLLPDLVQALQTMKVVLKPEGIIRGNLHSLYQRAHLYRAQKLFHLMGLMDSNPEETEIEIALQTMQALKDEIPLKQQTWHSDYEGESGHGKALTNYLLQGDRGYTIPDLFAALKSADLEFVSMVNWRQWDLMELFKDPNNLPPFWAMSLPELTVETRLQVFELLYPAHRLLDFWCAHPDRADSFEPLQTWRQADWQDAKVHLHPQLKTSVVREDLVRCVSDRQPFGISRYLSALTLTPVRLDSAIAACLLPLWEDGQPVMALVERWLQIRPLDPVTLQPVNQEIAFREIIQLLVDLEFFLYVLVEKSP